MAAESEARHRRSIRLSGYDYASEGAYFVTIVSYQREPLFGEVVDGSVHLTAIGDIVAEELKRTPHIRPNVEIDAFVIMPNHIHGIIIVHNPTPADSLPAVDKDEPALGGPTIGIHGLTVVGAHGNAPLRTPADLSTLVRRPRTLGSLIGGFKGACTTRINILRNTPGLPVWQRNYHDRVIRDEAELNRVRQYIVENPSRWQEDPENPAAPR